MTGLRTRAVGLPQFSIVLETENLETADIQGLVRSLDTLANQDPPPTCANEVLLIDSGDAPAELLSQLCQQYPWITVLSVLPGTHYYQAKMLGAKQATGEVVVYYDSDCLYPSNWLRTILTPFAESSEIQVVAGETTTRGAGPYGTAMSIVYIFPQFSRDTSLTPTHQYFLNNVAFRRELLLQHPIPTDLPLYRGHCVIHAQRLLKAGYTIWKQPQARATHAPPNGLNHFFWRFLLIGHDYYWQQRLLSKEQAKRPKNADPTMKGWGGKLRIFGDRISRMVQHNPRHLLYLPLAIPIILVAALLIAIGYWITRFQPKYLLSTFNQCINE